MVEAFEDVTVSAGTFESFKVVEYDQDGNPLYTSWYSDEAKIEIKSIDHETDEITELLSYNLAD